MSTVSVAAAAALLGRIFLSVLFVLDAWIIVTSYSATAEYMTQFGVPAVLLPAALVTQFAGGILVALGLWARLAALALAGFCLSTALLFHGNFENTTELIQFWKDVAIAGGFLLVVANGPGRWSLDTIRMKGTAPKHVA
jgi:putative oxidoreductase